FLSERIWFETQRRIEAFLKDIHRFGQQSLGDLITLPKLESKLVDGCLISDRTENESPIALEVVVLVEHATPFERKICRIDEVLMKRVDARVNIIAPIA